MNLSEISIRRPVLATVISLVLVLFGAISFGLLGVREYPAVDRRSSPSPRATSARTPR
jgi:multidrug efflux pump